MADLRAEAKALFEKHCEKASRSAGPRHGKNANWSNLVMKSGTLADRIAALSLAIKKSPRNNLQNLTALSGMLKKKNHRECLLALDALTSLYKDELLPSDRKLIKFESQSRDSFSKLGKHEKEETLVQWYEEDLIKSNYGEFVMELERLSKDQIETTRLKVLGVVHDLLAEKPEKEDHLLAIIANKLGDLQKKVAAKSCSLLIKLLRQHPNMKSVIVEEIERLLYRPNVSPKAQYYAVCFLIQIKLSDNDSALAIKLVKIYFSLFKAVTAMKATNSKMLGAILTGVNRAYPFTKGPQSLLEHIDTFFRYVHTVSAQIGIQMLMLLYQVMEREGAITDRFYMALYRKMMDPELVSHAGRSSSLLNLIYKAMKRDTELNRIKAFIKRTLQLAISHSPPFICGALIVVSEIIKNRPKGFLATLLSSVKTESIVDETQTMEDSGKLDKEEKCPTSYSQTARNPLYCGAEFTSIWEFQVLRQHYHPSVARFTECILQNREIDYAGDPFEDFTSMHFLDRFVYRNPKKKTQENARDMPVLSQQYLALPEKAIPDDEKFLHRYLTQKLKRKSDRMGHEDDVESVSDDEFDKFLDDYERDEEDFDMDFAADVNEEREEQDSLDDEMSLFGDDADSDDQTNGDFTAAEEDALNAAFSTDDDDGDGSGDESEGDYEAMDYED
ncbi:CCAAT/enhancer-binding protein zeta-like [Paramacrobiotus metropolitanus]|uniref:CCAAT/enhancer-binding protein zeta-like n=1 Tax=Paramacrobiotus metropolitanus TaxID=2943436 RepID=UPI002445B91C|nr:CCAAT/enhancer-binding protein zeta-like [Paramacrobiotus metropolitanus]